MLSSTFQQPHCGVSPAFSISMRSRRDLVVGGGGFVTNWDSENNFSQQGKHLSLLEKRQPANIPLWYVFCRTSPLNFPDRY